MDMACRGARLMRQSSHIFDVEHYTIIRTALTLFGVMLRLAELATAG